MAYLPDWDGHLPYLLERTQRSQIDEVLNSYKYGFTNSDQNKASPQTLTLSVKYLFLGLIDWHQNHKVESIKELAFISAKFQRMYYLCRPDASLAYGTFRAFTALLSDNPEIIHWFAWHVIPCLTGPKGRPPHYLQPNKLQFHTFNCHLAMMKELDWLGERSEQALAGNVKYKAGKSYLHDFLFFKALAEGNKQLMEDNIHALLKGRVAYTRNNENGMTAQSKVISTWGFMLAKMAYLNGYELDIDSPWVPQEWLPVKPLESYPVDIDFVSDFDLFTPFKGESAYFKNAQDFSPIHPLKPQPNIREWVEDVVRAYP
ncbi:hypothetical protein NBRC116188_15580 [Oceaniserpentilla sp. 4NH20-0058]|uniref:Imm49 family immunity protein n=1 Tax=Oceaniserpentilla sp. 4NH20-0058 TaxID=3127660 RepID=UPI003105149D